MANVADDLISEKYGRAFDGLDANGNGALEWDDLQALIDRFPSVYNLSKDDRRVRSLQAIYQMQWLELLRHAGVESDRLNREQYITASRLTAIDTSRLNIVEGSAHAVFDCIDVDGDDEISKDEYARYLRDIWQVTDPDAMESFTQLDTDGDGTISRQEFIRAIREYYHSNDSHAAGSKLLGHV
ncbi:EF-hand domain-containing protein [Streptomyces fulvorobeus]|uniref:Ca2+-binding EF-hand superfamily protein n=1 Tax=Streptomyces fulvorobeus TaxID=284028 RepID=A0A7J0CC88_9ACTN|nr:EF-hand domain-containing protein [Streptomyces fulvorobeus]NYE43523.1 Ca2+-binding EF-hand superfamily protein [Streptomyces fulvorobeus]GFM99998.1 calcium-binding protein [Streptomyces fulvorobeus]